MNVVLHNNAFKILTAKIKAQNVRMYSLVKRATCCPMWHICKHIRVHFGASFHKTRKTSLYTQNSSMNKIKQKETRNKISFYILCLTLHLCRCNLMWEFSCQWATLYLKNCKGRRFSCFHIFRELRQLIHCTLFVQRTALERWRLEKIDVENLRHVTTCVLYLSLKRTKADFQIF